MKNKLHKFQSNKWVIDLVREAEKEVKSWPKWKKEMYGVLSTKHD